MVLLSLCCCAQAFSSCGEWRLLFTVVQGLLTVVASFIAEYTLQGLGFRNCGMLAQQLQLMGSRAWTQ